MKLPESLIRKFLPLLLVLSTAVIMLNDRLFPPGGSPGKPAQDETAHDDHGDHDDHDDPEKNKLMGNFHYNEGNRDLAEGKLEEAIKNYKMALHHNDRFAEAYVNLSTAYLKARRFEEAGESLDRLDEVAPESPHLHYNRACLHSLTGKTAQSLEALQRAVDLGYRDRGQIETDPDLAALRESANYKSWFEKFSVAAGESALP